MGHPDVKAIRLQGEGVLGFQMPEGYSDFSFSDLHLFSDGCGSGRLRRIDKMPIDEETDFSICLTQHELRQKSDCLEFHSTVAIHSISTRAPKVSPVPSKALRAGLCSGKNSV